MVSESALLPQRIKPAQVWDLMPPERQQSVVRLLAHLAVHVITAQAPNQPSDVVTKECDNDYSSSCHQNPV